MVLPNTIDDREYQKFESTAPGPSVRVTGSAGSLPTEATALLSLAQLQAINADLDVALSTRASEATLALLNTNTLDIRPPHKIGYTCLHKSAEFTTSQTNTVIWPAVVGKYIVITGLIVSATGNTDATVTLFDSTNVAANWLFKGFMDVSVNAPIYSSPNLGGAPFVTSGTNQAILVTISANASVAITLYGYEADN